MLTYLQVTELESNNLSTQVNVTTQTQLPELQTKNKKSIKNAPTQFTTRNRMTKLSNEDQDNNMETNTHMIYKNHLLFLSKLSLVTTIISVITLKSNRTGLRIFMQKYNKYFKTKFNNIQFISGRYKIKNNC